MSSLTQPEFKNLVIRRQMPQITYWIKRNSEFLYCSMASGTLLHHAVINKDTQLLIIILRNGGLSLINQVDELGNSPLFYIRDQFTLTELLNGGANTQLINNYDFNVLEFLIYFIEDLEPTRIMIKTFKERNIHITLNFTKFINYICGKYSHNDKGIKMSKIDRELEYRRYTKKYYDILQKKYDPYDKFYHTMISL